MRTHAQRRAVAYQVMAADASRSARNWYNGEEKIQLQNLAAIRYAQARAWMEEALK